MPSLGDAMFLGFDDKAARIHLIHIITWAEGLARHEGTDTILCTGRGITESLVRISKVLQYLCEYTFTGNFRGQNPLHVFHDEKLRVSFL